MSRETGSADSYHWCHECKAWQPTWTDGNDFVCSVCGETILCDECGRPWEVPAGHDHGLGDPG